MKRFLTSTAIFVALLSILAVPTLAQSQKLIYWKNYVEPVNEINAKGFTLAEAWKDTCLPGKIGDSFDFAPKAPPCAKGEKPGLYADLLDKDEKPAGTVAISWEGKDFATFGNILPETEDEGATGTEQAPAADETAKEPAKTSEEEAPAPAPIGCKSGDTIAAIGAIGADGKWQCVADPSGKADWIPAPLPQVQAPNPEPQAAPPQASASDDDSFEPAPLPEAEVLRIPNGATVSLVFVENQDFTGMDGKKKFQKYLKGINRQIKPDEGSIVCLPTGRQIAPDYESPCGETRGALCDIFVWKQTCSSDLSWHAYFGYTRDLTGNPIGQILYVFPQKGRKGRVYTTPKKVEESSSDEGEKNSSTLAQSQNLAASSTPPVTDNPYANYPAGPPAPDEQRTPSPIPSRGNAPTGQATAAPPANNTPAPAEAPKEQKKEAKKECAIPAVATATQVLFIGGDVEACFSYVETRTNNLGVEDDYEPINHRECGLVTSIADEGGKILVSIDAGRRNFKKIPLCTLEDLSSRRAAAIANLKKLKDERCK